MSSSNTINDRELLDAIRAGDEGAEAAFRIVYDRHSQRVYAYCLKSLRSESRAGDIAQDVFMRLLITVRNGTMIENLPAFLMRICRNLCLNVHRDEHLTYIEPEKTDGVDENGETPEARDLREHIKKAINELPDEFREALVLQLYSGLSYAEICEVTGDTLPTIRHRISRAKQRLRTVLLPLITE